MRNINIKKFFKTRIMGNIIILLASIVLIYLLISIYFTKYYFFNTVINGVNVSLKAHDDVEDKIKSYIKDYKLQLIERDEEVEEIIGQDVQLRFNEKSSISKIYESKNSFKWISSLFKKEKYYIEDLFDYNKETLKKKINELNCLNKEVIEPKNVNFKYSNGSYEVVKEVYGNKVNKDKLKENIESSILRGETKLDLNKNLCYEDPKYTLESHKTLETKNLLNKYIKTRLIYVFGEEDEGLDKNEILDGNIINQWLTVDEELEVVINEKAVLGYVEELSKKYNTVGIVRNFKTALGKMLEIKGGFYGWKINISDEKKELLKNIKQGEVIEREPIYIQKAITRGKDDIGITYVEINVTRQHLWFYKEGRVIAQGAVVTGNPNRGNSTNLGVYMLNYKQKGATLRGANYESEVTYWMPFNGNIGIHDASWRYSFGGKIYKSNGTHGCVNTPLYLAKTIFENIEDGTPVICYEE
ncbi:L,D-transpeptidase family protein [Clostridium hydrogeniformans]|uniref:L,D-transpeptidase family protein n=1 Tax=Clostridium hydrogeniformans TaxID=349933 RepID=UPI0004869E51|nr:peptidoglycan binding domain-containing protein [Clostridium hydrogeniformans]